jgi:hypothetical protein
MDELVSTWISFTISVSKDATAHQEMHENEFFWVLNCVEDLCQDHRGLALDFVLEVLKRDPPREVIGVLAAGPLEDLLAANGPAVIDRVEVEARRDPKFRHLLGGVWRNAMTDDIWARVQRLASEKW